MSSVLITGASRGIGRAIATEFAGRGHRVSLPRATRGRWAAWTSANGWRSTSPTTPASRPLSRPPATSTY
ncbi:MAG TPA: SDR family NAD(P)-dependent oxidoreductase [Mycobacterium sp.]|nr:SDR family NAD(P)-dependent oxidoreductase [Mycobacterium sp.]